MPETQQVSLNNELHADKFKLTFREILNTEILCQGVSIPGVTGVGLEIPNSINKLFVQGTKLDYELFTIQFKVDENLTTWKEIYHWLLAIYAPQSREQFVKFQKDLKMPVVGNGNKFGYDCTLHSLKNSFNPNMEIHFVNCFPVSLSAIDFTLESSEIIKAQASFRYDYFYFSDMRVPT
jgi:hypothetical protein